MLVLLEESSCLGGRPWSLQMAGLTLMEPSAYCDVEPKAPGLCSEDLCSACFRGGISGSTKMEEGRGCQGDGGLKHRYSFCV